MDGSTKTTVTAYYPSKPITKLFVQIEKGVQNTNVEEPPSKMHRLFLRHIFWLRRMDYTVNNAKLVIAVQQQKKIWLKFHIHFYQA